MLPIIIILSFFGIFMLPVPTFFPSLVVFIISSVVWLYRIAKSY